jgi:formylglycine-generating enzyme required for sulfatase activity
MRRWFLSYNSQDFALAQSVYAALRRKDPDGSVFFAPKSLRAGSCWLPKLAEEITSATVVVLLVGEKGVGRWQIDEYSEARDRRVPVVLMLLEGQPAPGLPFLRTLHWIVMPDLASDACLMRLMDAAAGDGALPRELWRHTAPYRGLSAMKVEDSDYFFGRGRETIEIIKVLAAAPDKLPILIGNSGVGKTSLAQAGVLAALTRQTWPEIISSDAGRWPQALADSRHWCLLTMKPGDEPIRALVEAFLETWQLNRTSTEWPKRRAEWIANLIGGSVTLRDLLDRTERRHAELEQPKPPAFLLYLDQGEELYVRGDARERERFSANVAQVLGDPRMHVLMSLRADFFGHLQQDEPLFSVHKLINVPPLREEQLSEIVERPAKALSARFETEHLAADIARRTSEESAKDAGALPLLSYTLDDMWSAMVKRGDGTLRLPAAALELGGVLAERANRFLADHPQSEDELRRILTLRLASVREGGEPMRRRAVRSEFTDEEWRLVNALADHPNRLLVTAMPANGETYAEVAHEAIFKRWEKLKQWIAIEREFLIWKSSLESERHAWAATDTAAKANALLMGVKLVQAQDWLSSRAQDLSKPDRQFIEQSIQHDANDRAQRDEQRRRTRQMAALASMLLFGIVVGFAWSNRLYLELRMVMLIEAFRPPMLNAEQEHRLQPGDSFKECAHCPDMIVVRAGEFKMGSPIGKLGIFENEVPQHKVTIARAFAVSKFEITMDEWDACVALGGCAWLVPDDWGRGRRPVMYVNWADAQQYVAWLTRRTHRPYRLLSEAESEYAARAGRDDEDYSWGNEIGENNANCDGRGSAWDNKQTAPVGSFRANAWGLHDMHGNAWEWVEDCYHRNYEGAPADGSARLTSGECDRRVARGGSWLQEPPLLRSANRRAPTLQLRSWEYGFRVARTLAP